MYHSIGRISENLEEYKICGGCGGVNWHENEECVNCENEDFRAMAEGDSDNLLEIFKSIEIILNV